MNYYNEIDPSAAACLRNRQRLFFVAYASGAGREGHKQVRGLPGSSGQPSAEYGNAFMPSERALDSDFRLLRKRNGVSVGMERRRVHGFGNAIVPQVAARFIRAAA